MFDALVGKTKFEQSGLIRHYSDFLNPVSLITENKILALPMEGGHKADRIQKYIIIPDQILPFIFGSSDT
jgi:hypothetical protein